MGVSACTRLEKLPLHLTSLPKSCPQVAGPSRTIATSKAARYLQKRGSLLQSAASTQEGLSVLATNGWELSPRETLRRREHGAEQGKPPWQISIKTEQPFRVERPGSGARRPLSNQSVPAVTGGATVTSTGSSWVGLHMVSWYYLEAGRSPWQISINREQLFRVERMEVGCAAARVWVGLVCCSPLQSRAALWC